LCLELASSDEALASAKSFRFALHQLGLSRTWINLWPPKFPTLILHFSLRFV
jgi:hypothetical protein